VAQGIDVGAGTPDGTTALHWAVRGDNVQAVDLLLGLGASATAANRYGVSPLALAVENGNLAIAERLLRAGADARGTIHGGEPLILTAARTGDAAVIRLLLEHGADVKASEATRGQTALMWAAVGNNVDAIHVLLEAGADLQARAHGPKEFPDWARKEIEARTLAESRGAGGPNRGGGRPRSTALARYFDRVDELTPFLFAVRHGRIEAAMALLDAGADVNDTIAKDGTSALVLACANAHYELAALLLARGADPNGAAQGWSALHQIARNRGLSRGRHPHPVMTGNLDPLTLVEKLLIAGADVNAKMTRAFNGDNERGRFITLGATPLVLAGKAFDHELMRLLGANGADIHGTNDNRTTALMAASGVESEWVGEDTGPHEDALEALKVALELGGDVNGVNHEGDTPLHGAAYIGAPAVAQMLIDLGGRLDARNTVGNGRFCWLEEVKRQNPTLCMDWTPLTVALGRRQGFNLFEGDRHSNEAAVVIRRAMKARGIPIVDEDSAGLLRLDEYEASLVAATARTAPESTTLR
jgi:ankyrin repeat protein